VLVKTVILKFFGHAVKTHELLIRSHKGEICLKQISIFTGFVSIINIDTKGK